MNPKYLLALTDTGRYPSKHRLSSGTTSAREVRRAPILLKPGSSQSGPNCLYEAIGKSCKGILQFKSFPGRAHNPQGYDPSSTALIGLWEN